MIKEINTEEYDAMDKSGVMLLEFYSKSCGPCKMLAFVLKAIDGMFPDFPIYTIDFDENEELKERQGVKGFPTMLFMKDGEEAKRLEGLQQKPAIIKEVEALMAV
ncbi:thioredoxin family protein [Maridesulfovibrio sp.]|uniref:thioredoxin family protein n=1 Tax=Maridesulfovibrio sp. TaxID=2795000 RepID=UPI0039EF321A